MKYNKKYNKYLLSLLLIISIIVKTLNIDPIINLICLFMSCFVISYRCFNNIEESIKYAVFLVVIFELVKKLLKTNHQVFAEHLENKVVKTPTDDKEDRADAADVDDAAKADEIAEVTANKNELNELEKHLLDLDGGDEKQAKNISIDDMSPAHAQRELYRLIDTTNLLKKTMTEMTPVLNEGKKIMKSIESLNMLK
jgi:hypothetical protein